MGTEHTGPAVAAQAPVVAAVVARLRAAGCVRAEDEAALLVAAAADDAAADDALDRLVERRVAGEPLEHVLGWAEFLGLRVRVGHGVFVPRRRTEALALEARRLLAGHGHDGDRRAVVVDVCCGSGALGLAVAVTHDVELHAADLDPAAVACARGNLDAVGGTVHEGDLLDALPGHLRGRVDLLLANVPYVPTDHLGLLPTEARAHESRLALDGGPDGLDVLRRVATEAPTWLRAGGHLLSEVGDRQAAEALRLLTAHGLRARAVRGEGGVVVVGTALPSAGAGPRVRPTSA